MQHAKTLDDFKQLIMKAVAAQTSRDETALDDAMTDIVAQAMFDLHRIANALERPDIFTRPLRFK